MATKRWIAVMALAITTVSCSGDENSGPAGPSGPVVENLLPWFTDDSWQVESGTHHEWSIRSGNPSEIVHDQRDVEISDFTYRGRFRVPADGGVRWSNGWCAHRLYFKGCRLVSKTIDLSQWDSARITFTLIADMPFGDLPNGYVNIGVSLRSNVPGLPNLGLGSLRSQTNEEIVKEFDLSLEQAMEYKEATIVVYFDSDANCNSRGTGYQLRMSISNLRLMARRN